MSVRLATRPYNYMGIYAAKEGKNREKVHFYFRNRLI